jgi:hypothetical protein
MFNVVQTSLCAVCVRFACSGSVRGSWRRVVCWRVKRRSERHQLGRRGEGTAKVVGESRGFPYIIKLEGKANEELLTLRLGAPIPA